MENYTFVEHLNSINLQALQWNPVQMTTSVKQPMPSPPKQIPVKSLLFKVTSDHFFDWKMKK